MMTLAAAEVLAPLACPHRAPIPGAWVKGLGVRASDSGFRFEGFGCEVARLGFVVCVLGLKFQGFCVLCFGGLGVRVEGHGGVGCEGHVGSDDEVTMARVISCTWLRV